MNSDGFMYLDRRPDLPLCSMRQMRRRLNKRCRSHERGVHDVLTPKHLQSMAEDTRILLRTPIKVGRHAARGVEWGEFVWEDHGSRAKQLAPCVMESYMSHQHLLHSTIVGRNSGAMAPRQYQ